MPRPHAHLFGAHHLRGTHHCRHPPSRPQTTCTVALNARLAAHGVGLYGCRGTPAPVADTWGGCGLPPGPSTGRGVASSPRPAEGRLGIDIPAHAVQVAVLDQPNRAATKPDPTLIVCPASSVSVLTLHAPRLACLSPRPSMSAAALSCLSASLSCATCASPCTAGPATRPAVVLPLLS